MSEIGKLWVSITAKSDELQKGLGDAQKKVQNFGKGMQTTGVAASMAITAPIAAASAVIGKVANEAIGYQGQMNEVFTLMPGMTKAAMGEMSADVLDFAKKMGVIPQEVAPALYQAISAGVPANNVFDFLETAQKAAVGGVTDLTTAVDGISTVVNSYGADVMDAGKASDLMFTAVRLGKTTFEELSASLFNTLPTASALGVGFEEVTAAMASMTAQGVPTSVATTQMRQLLVELSKEGGKAAGTFEQLSGQSFKDFVASGGDVAGALAMMDTYAKETGVGINDLFGSVEAGNAALALSGDNAQGYINNLNEMNAAAGATDTAFQTMEGGVGRQMEKLKADFAAAKLAIGEQFLPIITDTLIPIFREQLMPIIEKVGDFIAKLAEKFGNLSPTAQKVIMVAIALAAALGPVLIFAGMIVSAIGALIPVFAVLLGPVGLVIAIVVALIAIGVLLYKNWDTIKEKAGQLWEGVKNAFSSAWEGIKTFFSNVWNWIKEFFAKWGPTILAVLVPFIGIPLLIAKNWEKIKGFFVDLWDRVIEHFKTLPGRMLQLGKDIIMGLINGIKDAAGAVWDAVKGVASGIVDTVKSVFKSSSPSKVFMEIGRDVGKGLELGMNQMQSTIGAAMHNLIPTPELSMAVSGGGGMAVPSGGGGGVVNNFNIDQMNVRDDQDVERIARELYRLQSRRDRGVN